jgi:hypothetical protein
MTFFGGGFDLKNNFLPEVLSFFCLCSHAVNIAACLFILQLVHTQRNIDMYYE